MLNFLLEQLELERSVCIWKSKKDYKCEIIHQYPFERFVWSLP